MKAGGSAPRARPLEATIGGTPRGRQSVEFPRSLLGVLRLSRNAALRPAPLWRIGIAAAIVLSILPVWLAFQLGAVRAQLNRVMAENAAQTATSNVPVPAPIETAFLLTPGLAPGSDG